MRIYEELFIARPDATPEEMDPFVDHLSRLPAEHRTHYLQPAVGHYGVFNGSRFRAEIAPRIADFVLSHDASTVRSAWRRKVAAQA